MENLSSLRVLTKTRSQVPKQVSVRRTQTGISDK